MGQLFLQDNIPELVRASTTTCTLAATSLGQPTRVTVGGQQYKLSTTLTLNTATTGINGLDTGTLGAIQLWYVYACISGGVVGLVASLTGPSTGPTGFTSAYKLVGSFYTDGSSLVGSVVAISGTASSEWMTYTGTITASGGGSVAIGTGVGAGNSCRWRRNGDSMQVQFHWFWGTTGTSFGTSGTYRFGLPVGSSIDTAKSAADGFSGISAGQGNFEDISTAASHVLVAEISDTGFVTAKLAQNAANIDLGVTSPVTIATQDSIMLNFMVPITGWKSTLL